LCKQIKSFDGQIGDPHPLPFKPNQAVRSTPSCSIRTEPLSTLRLCSFQSPVFFTAQSARSEKTMRISEFSGGLLHRFSIATGRACPCTA
jgi:hypothetical protein